MGNLWLYKRELYEQENFSSAAENYNEVAMVKLYGLTDWVQVGNYNDCLLVSFEQVAEWYEHWRHNRG